MIALLAGKCRKPVAILLWVIFYMQILLPVYANSNRVYYSPVAIHPSTFVIDNFVRTEFQGTKHEVLNSRVTLGPKTGGVTTDPQNDFNFQQVDANRDANSQDADMGNIGGPGQPEMSSFKSVNANDMVDLFTGDFSYNIPLMDVGGYPVNIHYSSGISMDQEASWVGLGWNINPGTVGRNMRGVPDDFDGSDTIARIQNIKINKTVGVRVGGDLEFMGFPVHFKASGCVFHNNYNGWGLEYGINASINAGRIAGGPLTASLGASNNSQQGVTIQPGLSYRLSANEESLKGRTTLGLGTSYNTRAGLSALNLSAEIRTTANKVLENDPTNKAGYMDNAVPLSGAISFAVPSYTPTISMPFTGSNFSFTTKLGGEYFGSHPNLFVSGYVSKQEIKPADQKQALPAVGYLYYTRSNGRANTLLDFNREKETSFNYNTSPMIALPQYSYDIYSISGEGTGGMFRPYRGDVGYIKDHYMKTKSDDDRFSADFGVGAIFHLGTDFNYSDATTQNGGWESGNDMNQYIKFRNSDTSYQPVYFRNPGEKTSNTKAYYQSIGDDALIRVNLSGENQSIKAANSFSKYKSGRFTGNIAVSAPVVKQQRDKRSQVITYLTGAEASIYGLDKNIISYQENTIPVGDCHDTVTIIPRVDETVRKPHHLSEMDVLNADGRRYVYGIPAYNVEQKDVTFAVDQEKNSDNLAKGLVHYTADGSTPDNSVNNIKGKDSYFTKDSMPAFAHSFLLTAVLSPDYVDIKNDGITQDDLGDAVKFNYTRIYGSGSNYYEWRTPFDTNRASYSEGLRTYNRDDKATYLYGKKEVWYLNSIESKTMVAVFTMANDRKDVYSAAGENGGVVKAKSLRSLKQIDLYAKADLIKDRIHAKPIKTVHFVYRNDLCKGIAGNTSTGKLTLDSIWFSYNGNEKGRRNPYVFKYHPGSEGLPDDDYNPVYNPKQYDRWGNYKNPADNPGSMTNIDYPYSQQDSTKAAKFASAWNLTDIQLPSGGKMKVTYESDDYGFVQNKRAAQMFQIIGISSSSSTTTGSNLYTRNNKDNPDNHFIFIHSDIALTNKNDILQKYLQGNEYIYFKIAVKMPQHNYGWLTGTDYEWVPGYAKVKDYGVVGSDSHKFWLNLVSTTSSESPLTKSALQFLRLNLPGQAYPYSEVGDNVSVSDAIGMLVKGFGDIVTAIDGFDNQAKDKSWCHSIILDHSFIRLDNPNFKKYGGGYRVKKIEIFDNWKKMTNQKESVYGQEYNYTTSLDINGQPTIISSGVASYEPAIGGEENPFHIPIEYAERSAPMAPVSNLFAEMPVGESYFPSAMVGYSKVRVRTINSKTRSANGWQETEFFTTKDFPTLVENTILDNEAKKQYHPGLQNFLKINSINRVFLSQGFKIELNDMNGKIKRQASYSESDPINPVSYVHNFYKTDDPRAFQQHLNNTVPAIDSLNGHIDMTAQMGKDIEIMMDMREQVSKTVAGNAEVNVDIFPIAIFPIGVPSFFPFPQREESSFHSAATVKIIQRYGILDSVVAMDKGSVVTTKNMIYDAETGEVLLSRTNNEFNDPVYNFSYPAHWAYSGMGMAYKNIDDIFTNLTLKNGKLFKGTDNLPFPVERFFESGDEIKLVGKHRDLLTGDNCNIFSSTISAIPLPNKVWAIEASKGKEKDRGIHFIDENGFPPSGFVDTMRILRSGKRNLLDAGAGSIVSLANPVREVTTGNFKVVFDTATKVLNTSAVTYKDLWQVENSLYQFDSCYTHTVYDSVVLSRQQTKGQIPGATLLRLEKTITHQLTYVDDQIAFPSTVVASHDYRARIQGGFMGRDYRTKSIVSFNFNRIPSGALVTNALLTLTAIAPGPIWPVESNSGYGNFNWAGASAAYLGSYNTSVKRVTTNWNSGVHYNDFGVSTLHQATISSTPISSAVNLNCTDLVKDVVTNRLPYYGFMIELQSPSDISHQTSYYSFSNGEALPFLKVNYNYSRDTCVKICRKNINDTAINPYRWGVLGNWRVAKAYTFYHDRVESDASIHTTDIRKEGLLKSFSTFWKFTDSVLLENPDTLKWVWNSAMSGYNRKGFETENYDPLGRYNSGLYGYNQTLPVAVAQNARYREILSDGFEDYSYKTTYCTTCDNPREFDFVKGQTGVIINPDVSHTGLYSMKVSAGEESVLTVPVTSSTDTLPAAVSIVIDSTPVTITTVVPKGLGLTGYFKGYKDDFHCGFSPRSAGSFFATVNNQGPINYYWGSSSPVSGMCHKDYDINWKGKIQPAYTDLYTFYTNADAATMVRVNGQTILSSLNGSPFYASRPISLEAGHLYNIEVEYVHPTGNSAHVTLQWSRVGSPTPVNVPAGALYKDGATTTDTAGSVTTTMFYCIKLNPPAPQKVIRPGFSPIQKSKMVISAWVRIDGDDCKSVAPQDGVIVVNFDPYGTDIPLLKTGVRIENWQRYEAVFTIPDNATKLLITSKGVNSHTIDVDDIRVQPYHSSMKGFVYDPVTLRLMSQLDENNYATFYEYDDDGTLIRIKKETERGIMTIQETRSALIKDND